jgi:hypothetical protein
MEKIRLFIFLGFVMAALASCSKKTEPKPTPLPPPDTTVTINPPGEATQLTPANNEPCTVGTNVTSKQSTVTFTWDAGTATDTYDVHIKNLVTGDSVVLSTPGLSLNATLALSTPYSWYLISKSKKSTETAQSDTWKFYNSGPGTTFYPPYPAENIYPLVGQTISFPGGANSGNITLKWKATAGSSPIKSYTLYFNNLLWNLATTEAQINETITTNSATVAASSGTTYYWEVVTTDAAGNTSTSQVYSFYVE